MKAIEQLIETAKGEWPQDQWEKMGILKAEEELRAINATLLAGEHIAKMCSTLRDQRDASRRKLDMLGALQHLMRDPERTLVCDVLANGQLLPDPDGSRYGGVIATPRLQEDT